MKPLLRRVVHPSGSYLARNGAPIESVCFPEGGICALLIPAPDRDALAIGMIGYEGLVGASSLHGADRWRHDVVARGCDVAALHIDADRLVQLCRENETLPQLLLRFAACFVLQVSRAVVTNLIEPLERRMARWILLYHDRLTGDDIEMTHGEMGIMLGVRRASATDVLHVLEGSGAIRSTRGHITIRDRALLETIAGETYGDAEAEYRRLIGPFGKPAGSAL